MTATRLEASLAAPSTRNSAWIVDIPCGLLSLDFLTAIIAKPRGGHGKETTLVAFRLTPVLAVTSPPSLSDSGISPVSLPGADCHPSTALHVANILACVYANY